MTHSQLELVPSPSVGRFVSVPVFIYLKYLTLDKYGYRLTDWVRVDLVRNDRGFETTVNQ